MIEHTPTSPFRLLRWKLKRSWKRSIYSWLTLVLILFRNSVEGSTCLGDERSLTERLFLDKQGIIFFGRVISYTRPKRLQSKNALYPIEGWPSAKSEIEICSQFFGKALPNKATFISGSQLIPGQDYLIFLADTTLAFGGNCDHWTKEITQDVIENELKLIRQFQYIIKTKASGFFRFQNAKGIVLAEGEFYNGKAIGLWSHFWENGALKSVHNLLKGSETQFTREGILNQKTTTNANEIVREHFHRFKSFVQLSSRITTISTDSGNLIHWLRFSSDGKLVTDLNQLDGLSNGVKDPNKSWYRVTEFYPNGLLKTIYNSKNMYSKNRINFSEDGTLLE